MSRNPTLSRDFVHSRSEECATLGTRFQTQARRLLDSQPNLLRFFKGNLAAMAPDTGEVSLYLLSVVVRLYTVAGGKLAKVSSSDVSAATARLAAVAPQLLPADAGFPERVRALGSRSQPHILDEALWALFERSEKQAGEVDLAPAQAVRVFFMLWAAVEALEGAWTPPAKLEDGVAASQGRELSA